MRFRGLGPEYTLAVTSLDGGRFSRAWRALGARGGGEDVFALLSAAYGEPHRAYHGAAHVEACLRLVDDPEVRALAARPAEVEAALWFHDAVYDTRAQDNEERSARLAEEHLSRAGASPEAVRRVAAHVRATKDHAAASPDGQLVVDVDLSILGEAPAAFARFEDEIRREYAWVDEAAYRAGRAAVLRRFAERPELYGTSALRDRYEAQARANLAAALARLAGA